MDGRNVEQVDLEKYRQSLIRQDEEKKKKLKKKVVTRLIVSSVGCFPFLLMLLVLFIAILVALGLLKGDGSVSEECIDVKHADLECSSITIEGEGVTVSLDEYVAGVVQNEYAAAPDEELKALAILARSYGLTIATKNGNGNCTVPPPSEGTQTYNKNITDRSQNVANETSGMILVNENGDPVHAEYSSCSFPKPYSSYGDIATMSERDLQIPKSIFDTYRPRTACTDNVLDKKKDDEKDWSGRDVYGSGHGRGMGQLAARYLAEEKGYTYDKLLEFFYGPDSVYNWSLASSSGSSRSCTPTNNGTLQPLKNYKTNHDGLEVLSHTLSESERDSLDDYLNKQINAAGYGTGAGVAAAGQSLVYWLEQNGLYLQYFWGGGQGAGDNTVVGASSNWGSTSYGADPKGHGKYFGMDCSGFVSWAVRTACAPNSGSRQADGWMSFGPEISLKDAKPGDVIANKDHVMLVVKNNGDGTVYVAEESNDLGFTLVGSDRASGRKVVDMTKWYKDNCDKKKGA